jgi:uncharacterized protein
MKPLAPSLCAGEVFHRRVDPVVHEFRYPLRSVWFDPDRPAAVADAHPLWSCTRPAPARFRASDYGDGSDRSLGDQARDMLAPVLGARPTGPVRMLTQWRRWGWLFNPITITFVWHDTDDAPSGAVLEVTNTPWKERHHYPVALERRDDGTLVAGFDKVLHVSPFLDEDHRYRFTARHSGGCDEGTLHIGLDVLSCDDGTLVLATGMRLDHRPVSRRSLGAAIRADGVPTHRVSAGIHVQAARLWRRVPYVPHPARRPRPAAGRTTVIDPHPDRPVAHHGA